MEWKAVKLSEGSKLFKLHQFTYLKRGVTYRLEIDEASDGTFTGHGEHSTDKNTVLESVSGSSVEDCLNQLIRRIKL